MIMKTSICKVGTKLLKSQGRPWRREQYTQKHFKWFWNSISCVFGYSQFHIPKHVRHRSYFLELQDGCVAGKTYWTLKQTHASLMVVAAYPFKLMYQLILRWYDCVNLTYFRYDFTFHHRRMKYDHDHVSKSPFLI